MAIDKQANDDVRELDRFREADRFAGEPLDPGAQCQMLPFNLLRMALARNMSSRSQMPWVCSPGVGKEARDAERR